MGCGSSSPADGKVKFKNGHPTFEGDEIIPSFKEGNGLLFRIVNKETKQWALYNDTKDKEIIVEVLFSGRSRIKALGKTDIERKRTGEIVASVIVLPLSTEMFIEGDVDRFTTKFDYLPVEAGSLAKREEVEGEAEAPADTAE